MKLKFRAWHKRLKEMYYFDLFKLRAVHDGNSDMIYIEHPDIRITDEDLMITQYTGCIINGQEIYDGDILRDEGDEGYVLYRVYWDDEDHMWSAKDIYSNDEQCLYEASTLRFMGNIYENPDLLVIS